MADSKVLLSLAEAAARAGVGSTTLRELIRNGHIAVVKIGLRGIRVPTAALEEWISSETKCEGERTRVPAEPLDLGLKAGET